MKKVSFVQAILMVCMLFFGSSLNAQTSTEEFNLDKKALLNSISDASESDKLALESIKSINSRMYRDFSKNYKNATDIRVSKVDNHSSISCYIDGSLTRIMYRKNGRWQHTVRTYENEKLPAEVRELVSGAYPRYSIFGGVIEVNVGTKTAYLVTIEDKTCWKRIRVVEDEMDVYEEYVKK